MSDGQAADIAYTNPVIRLGEFLTGIVLGCVFHHHRTTSTSGDPPSIGLIADVTSVLMVLIYALAADEMPIPLFVCMISPLTALWLYAMAYDRGYIAKMLQMDLLHTMGEWSYCTYVEHFHPPAPPPPSPPPPPPPLSPSTNANANANHRQRQRQPPPTTATPLPPPSH